MTSFLIYPSNIMWCTYLTCYVVSYFICICDKTLKRVLSIIINHWHRPQVGKGLPMKVTPIQWHWISYVKGNYRQPNWRNVSYWRRNICIKAKKGDSCVVVSFESALTILIGSFYHYSQLFRPLWLCNDF